MTENFQPVDISVELARKLISGQFPEFVGLAVKEVEKQGHDNRTYRLGENMLIRMPTTKEYALKVPKEQELLTHLAPSLSIAIPKPLKMGIASEDFPFPFSIYEWLDGTSANLLEMKEIHLERIALGLVKFLKELQSIDTSLGPLPGQHNWWRGDHVSVYDSGTREQIAKLSDRINAYKAIALWERACQTKLDRRPVWIHGDVSSGNILIRNRELVGVIDFGGVGVGDPACDLVIAWTYLQGTAREIFMQEMKLDEGTWLRAKAWVLWKASFELCEGEKSGFNSEVVFHERVIKEVLGSLL